MSSPCSHKCINSEGSFKCSCNSGSIFDRNTSSCKGRETIGSSNHDFMPSSVLQDTAYIFWSIKQGCLHSNYGCFYNLIPTTKNINFHSNKRNFQFTVLPSCGGVLRESNGEISSPFLPKPLPHDIECYWNIRVQRAIHVNINVKVSWRRDEECSNYVLIRYTSDRSENTVKICDRNDLRGGNIRIRSNDVWIKYHVKVLADIQIEIKNLSTSCAKCCHLLCCEKVITYFTFFKSC